MAAGLVDRIVPINGADALRLSRELAQKEGIFVGISAGAALAGGLEVARSAPAGSTILCMLPDTGERYLSTPLFEDIPIDMTTEELAISESTPMCRFDAPPPPAPAVEEAPTTAPRDTEAEAFVTKTILDEPVALFALEWCEFCWSVRKLFAALSIPYRSIDLDSVAYQKGDMGGRIRAALKARTGSPTIPQIFVGGEFVGGATDIFKLGESGDLQRRLMAQGTPFNAEAEVEYARLLPQWLSKSPKQPVAAAKG
jgi:cysteine synthase A